MFCTNGVVTQRAHPALEGTTCGRGMVCRRGACTLSNYTLELPSSAFLYSLMKVCLSAPENLRFLFGCHRMEVARERTWINEWQLWTSRKGKDGFYIKGLTPLWESEGRNDGLHVMDLAPLYMWTVMVDNEDERGGCSVECGGGIRVAKAECVSVYNPLLRVDDILCSGLPFPDLQPEECNLQPCFPGRLAYPFLSPLLDLPG